MTRDLNYKQTVYLYRKHGKGKSLEFKIGLAMGLRVGTTDVKADNYLAKKIVQNEKQNIAGLF